MSHEKNSAHYISKDSQNEILLILGNSIRGKMVLSIQNAKYHSPVLNDAGKTDPLSVIICFVSCSEEYVEIKEKFLVFKEVLDPIGQGLYNTKTEMWCHKCEKFQLQI